MFISGYRLMFSQRKPCLQKWWLNDITQMKKISKWRFVKDRIFISNDFQMTGQMWQDGYMKLAFKNFISSGITDDLLIAQLVNFSNTIRVKHAGRVFIFSTVIHSEFYLIVTSLPIVLCLASWDILT